MALYLKFFLVASIVVLVAVLILAFVTLGGEERDKEVFFRTLAIYIVILAAVFGILYFWLGGKVKTIKTRCDKQTLILITDNNKHYSLTFSEIKKIETKKHYNRYGSPTYMIVIRTENKKFKALDLPEADAKEVLTLLENEFFEHNCKDTSINFLEIRRLVK